MASKLSDPNDIYPLIDITRWVGFGVVLVPHNFLFSYITGTTTAVFGKVCLDEYLWSCAIIQKYRCRSYFLVPQILLVPLMLQFSGAKANVKIGSVIRTLELLA